MDSDPAAPRERVPLRECVARLREAGARVCLVEPTGGSPAVECPSAAEPAALEQLAARLGYERVDAGGRPVILPREPDWHQVVRDVSVHQRPRLEAADALIEAAQRAGLVPDLIAPVMRGDPRAPAYAQPVSLPASATLLEHLATLLGPDPELVFDVLALGEGRRLLGFTTVPSRGSTAP